MKKLIVCLIFLLSAGACTGVPELRPPQNETNIPCARPFVTGSWHFIHAIEAELRAGKKGFFMGVTRINSNTRAIQCVLMTLEGFVLLDATRDHELTIHRSVPPFDSTDLVRGLMADIDLAFSPPAGRLIQTGLMENGEYTCRYETPNRRIIDISAPDDSTWTIRRYENGSKLTRIVKASRLDNSIAGAVPIPGRIRLTALGTSRYQLILDLIEAGQEPFEPNEKMK